MIPIVIVQNNSLIIHAVGVKNYAPRSQYVGKEIGQLQAAHPLQPRFEYKNNKVKDMQVGGKNKVRKSWIWIAVNREPMPEFLARPHVFLERVDAAGINSSFDREENIHCARQTRRLADYALH